MRGRPPGALNGTHSIHTEPERDGPRQLSLPNIGGSEQLSDLVSDYGGIARVAQDFKVEAALLARYTSGQLAPPYSLLVALWWHTSYGFKQAFAEAHWTHQYNSFRRKEAEAKCRHLEVVVENAVRLLEHRADAADLVRQSLAHLTAERYSGDPLAGGRPLIRDGARAMGGGG